MLSRPTAEAKVAAAGWRPLVSEMQAALRRHVMDSWFPRCLDTERGGFISDFDQRWRRGPSTTRMLEFQARQMRVAARLALAFPDDGRWQEYALHGFNFLREMWDRDHGGWFWMVSEDRKPLAGATKHSHSAAYAVQSCALVFQATGERTALELAEEGLAWHDRHAHDQEHGGFHNWLTQDGDVIRDANQLPPGAGPGDPLGHDIGLKDVNVHGDWFEALMDLSVISGSPRARQLFEESARIFLEKAITPAGELHYAFYPDWLPQPGLEWYGYGFQAAQRLLDAARVLPQSEGMKERAGPVMRHAIRAARVRNGGFRYAGPSGTPSSLEGSDLRVPARIWWVQFEALRALAMFAANEAAPGPYTRMLHSHWDFIKDNLFDHRFGGVFPRPASGPSSRIREWIPGQQWTLRKGWDWKDASHDTCCLLGSIDALGGSP